MYENLKHNDKIGSVWHYCLDRVNEPLAVLYDGDLINVDDFVHVVCGKVICWNKEDLLFDDDYVLTLINFARNKLYVSPSQPRFTGHGNVMFIRPHNDPESPNIRFSITDHHINELPDVLKHNIKLCCPYYEEHGF